MDERSLKDSKRGQKPRKKTYRKEAYSKRISGGRLSGSRRVIKKLQQEKSLYAFTYIHTHTHTHTHTHIHTLMPKAPSFRNVIDLQQIYGQVLLTGGASVFPSVKLIDRA